MIVVASPGGESTHTKATCWSSNHSSVCSIRSSSTQRRLRSSSASRWGANAETSGSSSASSLRLGEKPGVICSRNPPSLPASRSGSTASRIWPVSADSSSGVSCTRPRAVTPAPSRMSGGSDSSPAECRDSSRWSFTSKVNPSGVIWAQRATVFCSGTA